jgi:hypothetical protein
MYVKVCIDLIDAIFIGCTYEGKSRFPSEKFYNKHGGDCTCGYDGEVACTYHCKYKFVILNT